MLIGLRESYATKSSGGQRNPPWNYQRRLERSLNLSIRQPGRTRDQAGSSRGSTAQAVHPSPQHNAPAVTDVDALDDKVLIDVDALDNRAKNNATQFSGSIPVVDLESERSTFQKREAVSRRVPSPSPSPPPEPAFSCPICMQQLDEEMTTKCGHIFCKKCIHTAISVKSICPTCRKKINKKDVIRIYLTTTT